MGGAKVSPFRQAHEPPSPHTESAQGSDNGKLNNPHSDFEFIQPGCFVLATVTVNHVTCRTQVFVRTV